MEIWETWSLKQISFFFAIIDEKRAEEIRLQAGFHGITLNENLESISEPGNDNETIEIDLLHANEEEWQNYANILNNQFKPH